MRCESCAFYDLEKRECMKSLQPRDDCSEYKSIDEEMMEGWIELCDWACREGVYDDITIECDCWDEYEDEELLEEEWEEDCDDCEEGWEE